MDVIDFILHKENTSKAAAIQKAKELLGRAQKTIASKNNPPFPFLEKMFV